jgi:predicted dehydrogenase
MRHMNDKIRIGIVGCGSVSEHYMNTARPLVASGAAEIVAVCDTREARRAFAQANYGAQRVTGDFEEVVASDDIDLVLVLTSMNEHGPIARAALQAGKHVLVEKPMATDLPTARELVALAASTGRILMPAPHVVLSPTFDAMAARIDAGDIGKVLAARAIYGWSGPEWGRWFYQKGGGPIFDLGVYNITTLTGWLGPAKRVMAMTGQAIPERIVEGEPMQIETEDNAHILLDFGGGVLASVFTGFTIQDKTAPALEIYGSAGVIQMRGDDWHPNGYEILAGEGGFQTVPETAPDWQWTDGLSHLVDCLRTGRTPRVTAAHGFHVLEIMLKAMQSGEEGRALPLESTFEKPRLH